MSGKLISEWRYDTLTLPCKPQQSTNEAVPQLLGQCLERLDGDLHKYLQSKGYSTRDYAKRSTISLSAFGQPPEEVGKLWDLFLSHGLHLNVLVPVSRIRLRRDGIMGRDE